ncbi:MAG: hypothetical protein ABIO70_09155 [Pseudomonadota bacterium]
MWTATDGRTCWSAASPGYDDIDIQLEFAANSESWSGSVLLADVNGTGVDDLLVSSPSEQALYLLSGGGL